MLPLYDVQLVTWHEPTHTQTTDRRTDGQTETDRQTHTHTIAVTHTHAHTIAVLMRNLCFDTNSQGIKIELARNNISWHTHKQVQC